MELKKLFEKIGNAFTLMYEHASFHKNVLNPQIIKNGWYPSSVTLMHNLEENETIDCFMERCISGGYYKQIKEDYILNKYVNRTEIFQEAFDLYEDGRYIACIPLFLSQIDGIIMESGLKGFFIGRNQLKEKFTKDELKYIEYLKLYLRDSDLLSVEDLVRKFFLSLYEGVFDKSGNLSISNESSKIDAQEIGYFNRHGILHGHSDYLKYGSKINALKAISLLLFVIQTLEILNQKFD